MTVIGALDRRRVAAVELTGRALLAMVVWRFANQLFWYDVVHYAGRSPFTFHSLPYRDRLWEYPPLTLVPVLVAQIAGRWFPTVFVSLMVACEYGSLTMLRRAFPHHRRRITSCWSFAVVPISLLAWFRLDFMVVLLATAAILAVERERPAARWVILGFATKLWPVILIASAACERRWREAATSVVGCVGVIAVWWAFSPAGFAGFLRFRRASGLEVESLLGAVLVASGHHPHKVSGALVVGAGGWQWIDPAGLALLGLASLVTLWWARRRQIDSMLACGGLVALSMLGGRILSPQYLTWLAPFVIVGVVREHRGLVSLYTVTAWLTVTYLFLFGRLVAAEPLIAMIVIGRNVVLFGLMLHFFYSATKLSPTDRPAPAAASGTSVRCGL